MMADPTYRPTRPGEAEARAPSTPPRPVPPAIPHTSADGQPDDRSIGDLLSELASETTTLLKQEVALAKAEVRQEVSTAGRHAAYVAAGGAVAYSGLIVLLIGIGWALGELFGEDLVWLGLLLIGAIVAAIGYTLVQKGLSRLKEMDPTPERTVETLKQDQQWLKEELKH